MYCKKKQRNLKGMLEMYSVFRRLFLGMRAKNKKLCFFVGFEMMNMVINSDLSE